MEAILSTQISFLLIATLLVIGLIVLLVKSKIARLIFGIIFTIGGVGSFIIGAIRSSTLESKLLRAFGGTDDVLSLCLVAGGVFLLVGIILLALSRSPAQTNIHVYEKPLASESVQQVVKVRCTSCQALNTENAKFCESCGTELVNSKQGDGSLV